MRRRPTVLRRRATAAALLLIVLAAAAAPLFATHDYAAPDHDSLYVPPGTDGHLLGTDFAGRDLWSRLLYGGRISLAVGFAAAAVSGVVGLLYGAVAGYAGGRTDALLMRAADVAAALPFLFVVVLLTTLLTAPTAGPVERTVVLLFALGAVQWLSMARIVRGEVLSLKTRAYVEAARALGCSPGRILFRHLVPNLLPTAIVFATISVPRVMLQEAFLSFVGLGVPPPFPSWGGLAADGVRAMTPVTPRWWLVAFPAAAITLTLVLLNAVGEALSARVQRRRTR